MGIPFLKIKSIIISIFLLFCFSFPLKAQDYGAPAGEFDFYVLALSWSPSFCIAEGSASNPDQCQSDNLYSFIVHGLWPQYERGYPEYCRSRYPRNVAAHIAQDVTDIVPGVGLVGHQWRKHGMCSGLGQEDYFDLLRSAYEHIQIPDLSALDSIDGTVEPEDIKTFFRDANPGIPEDGMSVTCDRRYLREVRICMTKELEFRSCPEVAADACRRDAIGIPAPMADEVR